MGFTIDEAAVKKQFTYDLSKPQEQAPAVLPENWVGTVSRGLPVKQIPHYDFPRCVYLHPIRPTITVLHRNAAHELVEEERIPTEHQSRIVGCEAARKIGCTKECQACNELLEAALADGWVTTPYIPEAPAKADADLYGPRKKK